MDKVVKSDDVGVCEMRYASLIWEQVWKWIDWHGRIATVLAIIVSLGGAALVNRFYAGLTSVHGVYLWVITALTFVVFIGFIVLAARKLHPTENKPSVTPLDVNLLPSSGPSNKMLLTVTNNSNVQKFHAQCAILGRRNDPNILFQKPYDLPWEDHSYRHATIVRGESRNLLIATADENRQRQTAEVSLIERQAGGTKRTVEWSRWDRSKIGPEYDLEVAVFGEVDATPYREQFTLKCGGTSCALEMTRLGQKEVGEVDDSSGPDLSLEWYSAKTYPNYDRVRLRNIGTSSAFNIELNFTAPGLSFLYKFELNVLHANQESEREVSVFERTNGHSEMWRMENLLAGNHIANESPLEVVATFFGSQREAFEKAFRLELGSGGNRIRITPNKRNKVQAAS